METHGGGSREWRGISGYQVEDDLHGGETHAHNLDWNFVWSVYLFARPSGDNRNKERGEKSGPGRALITQDTSSRQSPLDSKSTGQRLHLTRNEERGSRDYCWLD